MIDANGINKQERIEKLEKLKKYYLNNLCEDPQDGTAFDMAIIEVINNLYHEFKLYDRAGLST